MVYRLPKKFVGFPDAEEADENGLVAVGGSLSVEHLVNAYALGLFPWYIDHRGSPYWYSPDPRMVLFPDQFRCSKSLRRVMRSGRYEVRIDTHFADVMCGCATTSRVGQGGTWITPEYADAYGELHRLGLAHSFETYHEGVLVGGLYGVSLGRMFFGESMFHTMTDASKVAFARLVEVCLRLQFCLIDAQQENSHLASLGARPISRKEYLRQLRCNDLRLTLQKEWTDL